MEEYRDYRALRRRTLARLLAVYLVPLLLLAVYFNLQQRSFAARSTLAYLVMLAEGEAGTLDLFLRERMVDLKSLAEDARLVPLPAQENVEAWLQQLRRESMSFVDIGLFSASGRLVRYAGPYPWLAGRDYSGESWWRRLAASANRSVLTDMYLGFRRQPHFTLAVRAIGDRDAWALRATLDPQGIYRYITGRSGSARTTSTVINAQGMVQVVGGVVGSSNGRWSVPPRAPRLGVGERRLPRGTSRYAYCWLSQTGWAVVVEEVHDGFPGLLAGFQLDYLAVTAAVILGVFSIILVRAGRVMAWQREQDQARAELSAQLQHAARLASVGELAGGVAHEINNPLAIIAEEVGLIRDLLDPRFGVALEPDSLATRFETVQRAVFRARDVTRKLLTFVRRSGGERAPHDLNQLVEDALRGFLEHELRVSNVELFKDLTPGLPPIMVDPGPLEQVIINLVGNAMDAVGGGGRVTVSTFETEEGVAVAVKDTGCGVPSEHLDKIFLPFFTTKEVGKGTGLGLSVSQNIITELGGEIRVASEVGMGSTFTVLLPTTDAAGPRGGAKGGLP